MEYAKMTIAQLRALAKEKGITKISTLKKNELIARLEEEDSKSDETIFFETNRK